MLFINRDSSVKSIVTVTFLCQQIRLSIHLLLNSRGCQWSHRQPKRTMCGFGPSEVIWWEHTSMISVISDAKCSLTQYSMTRKSTKLRLNRPEDTEWL